MYYLSQYIGAGTRRDPFRPLGSDQPGWSAIDLRPDSSRSDGGGLNACFLHLPVPDPDPRLMPIGDDPEDMAPIRAINAKLRTRIKPGTVRNALVVALTHPPRSGWKRLMPSMQMLTKEIHLGGLLWQWKAPHWKSVMLDGLGRCCLWGCHTWLEDLERWVPVMAGGADASDSFDRANETPLAGNWTQQPSSTGTVNLSSNALAVALDGDKLYYWNATSFAADQDISLTWVGGVNGDGGPAPRIRTTSSLHAYFLSYASNPPIAKFSNGVYSALGGTFHSIGANTVIRLQTSGSTLNAFTNGNSDGSAVDTEITSAGAPGFFAFSTTDTWDNWQATDGILSASQMMATVNDHINSTGMVGRVWV